MRKRVRRGAGERGDIKAKAMFLKVWPIVAVAQTPLSGGKVAHHFASSV